MRDIVRVVAPSGLDHNYGWTGYARVLSNQAHALAHLGMFSPVLEKLSEVYKLAQWYNLAVADSGNNRVMIWDCRSFWHEPAAETQTPSDPLTVSSHS